MAFSFVNATQAGGLIPVEYSREIIEALPRASAALSLFRRVDMGTSTTVIPVTSALPTASFVSAGSAIPTTTPTWTGKNLVAEKLGCIVPIAKEIVADSSYDFAGDLIPKVVQAMGAAIDGAVFYGVNKPSTWTSDDILAGCTAASATSSVAVTGTSIAEKISEVMGFVEEAGYDVNGFAGATAMKATLRGLKDDNGVPLFQPLSQASPATIYGEAAYFPSNGGFDKSKALLFAGNFGHGIVGLRQDITMEVLTEATLTSGSDTISLAQNDMIGLKFVMRVAFACADVATAEGGAASYPFAALIP